MARQKEGSWQAMVKGLPNWRCTKPLKRTEMAKRCRQARDSEGRAAAPVLRLAELQRGRGLRRVPALRQPDPTVGHLLIQCGSAGPGIGDEYQMAQRLRDRPARSPLPWAASRPHITFPVIGQHDMRDRGEQALVAEVASPSQKLTGAEILSLPECQQCGDAEEPRASGDPYAAVRTNAGNDRFCSPRSLAYAPMAASKSLTGGSAFGEA